MDHLLEDIYRDYILDRMEVMDLVFANAFGMVVEMTQPDVGLPVVEARTDNMHDTNITTKMADFCRGLSEAPEVQEEALILALLAQDLERKRKLRALRALALVLEQDVFCGSYGMSEGALLRKMAEPAVRCLSAGGCPHEGRCRSKLENLLAALADMFDESGEVICVMGRMTSIYDALCEGDYLVPKNFLEQEIASKCSVLIKELGD